METGARVADRYRIEKTLGKGGMGEVYLALDEKFGTRVALKVARASGSLHDGFRARFIREARLGNRLGRTEGFVRALDWGELDDATLYLAMDLVEGARGLDLESGGLEERLARLKTATRLVAVVHERGVIHRDLKPANFLQDTAGKVWLADFGLAKVLGDVEPEEDAAATGALTQTGIGFGTPAFMSPEQFEDAKSVDARTDVYALGCMLYLAITGRLPFEGTPTAIVKAHERIKDGRLPMPVPRALVPETPAALDALCARAMALEPSARLATAGELVSGLEAIARGETVMTPIVVRASGSRAALETVHEPRSSAPLDVHVEPRSHSAPTVPEAKPPISVHAAPHSEKPHAAPRSEKPHAPRVESQPRAPALAPTQTTPPPLPPTRPVAAAPRAEARAVAAPKRSRRGAILAAIFVALGVAGLGFVGLALHSSSADSASAPDDAPGRPTSPAATVTGTETSGPATSPLTLGEERVLADGRRLETATIELPSKRRLDLVRLAGSSAVWIGERYVTNDELRDFEEPNHPQAWHPGRERRGGRLGGEHRGGGGGENGGGELGERPALVEFTKARDFATWANLRLLEERDLDDASVRAALGVVVDHDSRGLAERALRSEWVSSADRGSVFSFDAHGDRHEPAVVLAHHPFRVVAR